MAIPRVTMPASRRRESAPTQNDPPRRRTMEPAPVAPIAFAPTITHPVPKRHPERGPLPANKGRPPIDPTRRMWWDHINATGYYHPDDPQGHAPVPVPKVILTDAQIVAEIEDSFNVLNQIAQGAARGYVKAVVVVGVGGVGKTYTIEKILNDAKENHGILPMYIQGVVTPIHLYGLLFKNRHRNCVLVMDDSDEIWDSDPMLNILKAGLDTKAIRTIQWHSESRFLRDENIPSSFQFEGTIIFITNRNLQAEMDQGRSKRTSHIQAFMTRAVYLDLNLHDRRSLALWVRHVVLKNHILVSESDGSISREVERDLVEWIVAHRNEMRELSIRTAIKIGQFWMMNKANWQTMASKLLKRSA